MCVDTSTIYFYFVVNVEFLERDLLYLNVNERK